MVGFIVVPGMPIAFVVGFVCLPADAFAGACVTTGFPVIVVGMAFIVALGMAFIVTLGIVFIVGEAIVAIGFIVGVTVAAVDTVTTTATNDARTSSANATFNILKPIPPQYPLCRTTHQ
jgi:hypothetical protein